MSMCKSSTVTGTLAEKSIDWTKVLDEELATNIDDTDLVGDAKAREKRRRMCVARDTEIRRAEEARQEAERKCQVEEAEKHWKEEEERRQREAEAETGGRGEEVRGQKAAVGRFGGPGKWEPDKRILGVKKWLACGSCTKAKERCEWLEVEMTASRAGMSPQGGEHKKQAKKAADGGDDDEIVILSGWKTKQQGGSEMPKEITNRRQRPPGEDSERSPEQWQMLLLKLVEMTSDAGSGRAKEVVKGEEEPKELQGEESEGQEGDTEGVPGGAPEGELEDAPGNELEDGAGAEDGTEEDAQKRDKGKGKEKAT
ncbi:hypothetical protein ID866_11805 [Astraeus odoratus]|nr:hypothetical protein ID866_11805 [Astraeus odoratus]